MDTKIKFPVTVKFDNFTEEDCETMQELKDAILDAHSEQTFCDSIVDANGKEYGCDWDVAIVSLQDDD